MRLIDADMLIKTIPAEEINARFAIAAAPTIEVDPVKHGRWKVLASGNDAVCTNCKHYWIPNGDQYDYNYCPHCGAKMDE